MDEASSPGIPPPLISAQPFGLGARLVELHTANSTSAALISVAGLPKSDAQQIATLATAAIRSLPGVPLRPTFITVKASGRLASPTSLALPVALAFLRHVGHVPVDAVTGWLIVGELGLAGSVHATRGILAITEAGLEAGLHNILAPAVNALEAANVRGARVAAVASLRDAVVALAAPAKFTSTIPLPPVQQPHSFDFRDIPGRDSIKLGLTIAAAGGHGVMLRSPAGSGKVMLARRFGGLLPPLSDAEARETTKMFSLVGLLPEGAGLINERPFRAPHHTISEAGLVGGGILARPGEASLAQNGVLLLDELPEFRRTTLGGLTTILRDGTARLSRTGEDVSYPARFHLLATMDQCRCGAGAASTKCNCTAESIRAYHARVPPFLADRFDITLDVPINQAHTMTPGTPTADYRGKVEEARSRQAHRFARTPEVTSNANLSAPLVASFCPLAPTADTLLRETLRSTPLSDRLRVQLLAVARTCADVHGREHLSDEDIALALLMPPFALAAERAVAARR